MTGAAFIWACAKRISRRFGRDERGATLLELALVLPIFLLIFLGFIDFGRMAFHYVTAEKAMQVAARVAAVRPPACTGVPEFITRGSASITPQPEYGTSCRAGSGICADPGTFQCNGNSANDTAQEIWEIVRGTLPNDATITNLSFSYATDSNLGFLGGPYTPVVTVELQNLEFDFISPLAGLVNLAGGTASGSLGATISFPGLSASLPAEDLASGENG